MKASPLRLPFALAAFFAASLFGSASVHADSHKIGLIDMGYIFKNYQKFKDQRDIFLKEAEKSNNRLKAAAKRVQDKRKEMTQLKEGTPAYDAAVAQIAKLVSEFETTKKVERVNLLRKETQVYKEIYMEVAKTVKTYAEHYKYTLVIRFDREVLTGDTKTSAVSRIMGKRVIYHQQKDDLTAPILNYINKRYKK